MLLNFLNRISGKYTLIVVFFVLLIVYIRFCEINRAFLEEVMKMIIVAAVARLGTQSSQQFSKEFHKDHKDKELNTKQSPN